MWQSFLYTHPREHNVYVFGNNRHTATHPPSHDSVLIFVILCLAFSDLSEEQVHGIHSAFMLSNVILCISFFAPLLTGNLSPKKCTLFGGGLVYGRPATDPRETREKFASVWWRESDGGILKIVLIYGCEQWGRRGSGAVVF